MRRRAIGWVAAVTRRRDAPPNPTTLTGHLVMSSAQTCGVMEAGSSQVLKDIKVTAERSDHVQREGGG